MPFRMKIHTDIGLHMKSKKQMTMPGKILTLCLAQGEEEVRGANAYYYLLDSSCGCSFSFEPCNPQA